MSKKLLQDIATVAEVLNTKATMEEIVKAVETIAALYRQVKADTEAERAARDQQFGTLTDALKRQIDAATARLKDGHTPTAAELLAIIKPLIPAPTPKPTDDELTALMRPLIPIVENGEDGSPDTADDIRNKLELLTGKERLAISAIDGLKELLDEYMKKVTTVGTRIQMGGTTGRDLFNDIDLSPQLDGVTTTFQIHAVYNIISVHLSSFPHALRKNIDFTYTPTTITFTSQIDPSTALALGQTCVLTVVNA